MEHIKDLIPIIESDKGGHWEIYPDRKIWHPKQNIMANPILEEFQDKKRAESDFITLSDDGEKASGLVKDIKRLSKIGFGGKEVEVIRLEIETKDGIKNFDKGSKQWIDELVKKEVDVGTNITIIRHGIKDDKKTTYEIIKGK